MNEDGRIRHQYYKGLRVINVISNKELVAWEEVEICFRDEGEDVLSEEDYSILKSLIGLYSKASENICRFRELSLGARFINQRYGFNIETLNFMKKEQFIPFINEMFVYLLSLDTKEKMNAGLIENEYFDNYTPEEKQLLSEQLVTGLDKVRPEIYRFLKMINEEGRFVYITSVLD